MVNGEFRKLIILATVAFVLSATIVYMIGIKTYNLPTEATPIPSVTSNIPTYEGSPTPHTTTGLPSATTVVTHTPPQPSVKTSTHVPGITTGTGHTPAKETLIEASGRESEITHIEFTPGVVTEQARQDFEQLRSIVEQVAKKVGGKVGRLALGAYETRLHEVSTLTAVVEPLAARSRIPTPLTPAKGYTTAYDMQTTKTVRVPGVDELDDVKVNGTHAFVLRKGLLYIYHVTPLESARLEAVVNVTKEFLSHFKKLNYSLVTDNITVSIVRHIPAFIHSRGLLLVGNGLAAVIMEANLVMFKAIVSVEEEVATPMLLSPVESVTGVLIYNGTKLVKVFYLSGRVVDAYAFNDKIWVITTTYMYKPILSIWKLPVPSIIDVGDVIGIKLFNPLSYLMVSVYDVQENKLSTIALRGAYTCIPLPMPPNTLFLLSTASVTIIFEKPRTITIKVTNREVPTEIPVVLPVFRVVYATMLAKLTYNGSLVLERVAWLEGKVPRNYFALDVKDDVLRIVLEKAGGGFRLYTVDIGKFKVLAKLDVPRKFERVHAIRFIGDKLYIVTYRNIDPLFVIDVSDPSKPKVIGFVKGPGFEDYIHPLNATLLLGVGYTDDGHVRITLYRVTSKGDVIVLSRLNTTYHFTFLTKLEGYRDFLYLASNSLAFIPVLGRIESRCSKLYLAVKIVLEKPALEVVKKLEGFDVEYLNGLLLLPKEHEGKVLLDIYTVKDDKIEFVKTIGAS